MAKKKKQKKQKIHDHRKVMNIVREILKAKEIIESTQYVTRYVQKDYTLTVKHGIGGFSGWVLTCGPVGRQHKVCDGQWNTDLDVLITNQFCGWRIGI